MVGIYASIYLLAFIGLYTVVTAIFPTLGLYTVGALASLIMGYQRARIRGQA